ncbi:MAG: CHAT domain-containing protein [Deltaproteobacteria bacterium]|nr:CHAT domain-containing protein [Deltaproteobacteria bacterium]
MSIIADSFLDSTDFRLALYLDLKNHSGQHRAAQTILASKGLVLESAGNQYRELLEAASPATQKTFATLRSKLTELATRIYARQPSDQPRLQPLAPLQQEIEQLETELARTSPGFRQTTRTPQIEEVRQALPPGTVLVEFYLYWRYSQDLNAPPQPRYAAYMLSGSHPVQAVDIGAAEAVENEIATLREALQASGNGKVVRIVGARLYHLLFRKLARQLTHTKRVLISADGELNLMPFEVLVDEQGRYLVERWETGTLATGRDVLRWRERRPSQSSVVALARPDYDADEEEQARQIKTGATLALAPAAVRRANPLERFDPLAGMRKEGDMVKSHFPAAIVLPDGAATEKAVKALHGPRILHLATHGFVLKDREFAALPTIKAQWGEPPTGERTRQSWDDPMLRAGVALAGANVRQAAGTASNTEDDGILTAAEAARLDLRGTQVVLLSACETGLGEVWGGEGVMGLRRAFELAGARSQLFSLGVVNDLMTVQLMDGYYTHLAAGKGHAASWRTVQLEMLAKGIDPSVWASFVAYGNPGPIGP